MSNAGDPLTFGGGWWQHSTARLRLATMVALGAAAAAVTGLAGQWDYAPMIGWDVAAAAFVSWSWLVIASLNGQQTAAHATRDDPGRTQSDLIVVVAAVASLAAVGFVLIGASTGSELTKNISAGLGLISVALSWAAVHTLYTLRYARLYYTGPDGGIDFNQKSPPPRYLDFAYLAFTLGMTYQVSDTDLQTPTIRATALRQALISHLLGAVILATTINLVSGLASK